MDAQTDFDSDLFGFFTELAANNSRDWFQANKQRFREQVQEPLMRFIGAFAPRLAEISPHFVADPRPSGGSMFRIYRDVRFSKDKSPYKTHAAAQFRHARGRDVHAPGFYLHLEPGNVFFGAGLWHPTGESLHAIRAAIDKHPKRWRAAISNPAFTVRHELGGDTLKRAPRGFDPEHPLIDDLKRKDFVCFEQSSETTACSPGFLDLFTESCRTAAPLVRFLTEAVGLEF